MKFVTTTLLLSFCASSPTLQPNKHQNGLNSTRYKAKNPSNCAAICYSKQCRDFQKLGQQAIQKDSNEFRATKRNDDEGGVELVSMLDRDGNNTITGQSNPPPSAPRNWVMNRQSLTDEEKLILARRMNSASECLDSCSSCYEYIGDKMWTGSVVIALYIAIPECCIPDVLLHH